MVKRVRRRENVHKVKYGKRKGKRVWEKWIKYEKVSIFLFEIFFYEHPKHSKKMKLFLTEEVVLYLKFELLSKEIDWYVNGNTVKSWVCMKFNFITKIIFQVTLLYLKISY